VPLVPIGYVLRAHGVRGLVRVHAESDSIASLTRITVGERELRVVRATPERGDWLVQLEGVTDRDQAEALRGQPVRARREELPPTDGGELYVADLLGCAVVDTAGAALGTISGTFPGGAHEILVVTDGAREALIPFVEPIIVSVDVEARRVVCDPPPGLINLDEAEVAGDPSGEG
jgi:16S rRNA processing protein RimM